MFTQYETLDKLARLLIEKGAMIIAPSEPSSYFSFIYGTHFGYIQYDFHKYSGAKLYIPSRDCGSGQNAFETWDEPTWEHIQKILYVPCDIRVQFYTTLSSYLSRNTWRDLILTDKESTGLVPKK